MENITFVLDLFTVIAAAVVYFTRPRIGGQLDRGVQKVLTGILLLGISHLTKILFFVLLNMDPILNEIIHGLLEAGGLIFVIMGFARMRMAFDPMPEHL